MPSTESEAPLFTRIDWSDHSAGVRVRPRTVGLVAALAALAAVFAYDYVVAPPSLVWTWDLTRMDWLFFLSVILFARYAVVPLVADGGQARDDLRAFLGRPAGVLGLAWVLGFGVFGLAGPELVGMPRVNLSAEFQPPVYLSTTPETHIAGFECLGPTDGDTCYGTWEYPLGTTRMGEDMVNVLMYGAHVALKLAVAAGTIMVVVATAVGTTAGYFGGRVDAVLMRYVDVQQTIPAIVVYIIVASLYLGKGLFTLALVFGLLDWGGIARLVRSETLKRKQSGYVRAARSAGASDLHVIRRHVIPNSKATVVTALTRQIPLLVLAQVALSFLDLNVVRLRSLGGVLQRALPPFGVGWWVAGVVTAFLVVTVVAFNVLGDTARDVLDAEEVS